MAINWKKNSWHRVVCSYKANSKNSNSDYVKIMVDGSSAEPISYGSSIAYGDDYRYGQLPVSGGNVKNVYKKVSFDSGSKSIYIGSSALHRGEYAMARIDNLRISRKSRDRYKDINGMQVDPNYSSNIKTIAPVIEDDLTTYIFNFDDNSEKFESFITVRDDKKGIFDFDIEVVDDLEKVIGINDGEIEDLIVELVERLKPAHSNALVKFIKNRC